MFFSALPMVNPLGAQQRNVGAGGRKVRPGGHGKGQALSVGMKPLWEKLGLLSGSGLCVQHGVGGTLVVGEACRNRAHEGRKPFGCAS